VTDTTSPSTDTSDELQTTVLQRLVLPPDADFDTLPLYVEGGVALPGPELPPGTRSELADLAKPATVEPIHPDLVLGRRSMRIPAGTRVSFATYFNAFPASYWRRWTFVDKVVLRVGVQGAADVLVYRSSARGDQHRMAKETVGNGGLAEFELPLDMFGDGGWYWFDIVAGMEDATLEFAEWSAPVVPEESGRISIAITTFNRPSDCVLLLKTLSADPQALSLIDSVFVIDQGTQKVEDDPDFADAAAVLGDHLKMVHQPNHGGSGGFSRGMYETTFGEQSRYVLLLDDDALVEPEGILRAVTFADLCRTPTIVGGHMLNMHVKSTLHAFGERVNRYRFWWSADPHTKNSHNFAEAPLRTTRWLHRRVDVDYNGWWMCLIPTDVVRDLGLALPIFIKWDDAEYALRAKEAGVPTVTLPGAAVWHVNWADKDDAVDWQAYHHARNRILVALLHSPYPRGGRLLVESMAAQLKHAISMQYSTAELRLWALEDILEGPVHLHRDLPTKLGEIRAYRAGQDDALIEKDPLAFPTVKRVKPPKRGKDPTEPKGLLGRYLGAAAGVYRQMQPVRATSTKNPEARVPAMDARWRLLSQFDSAVVSTADGSGASWYKRDRTRFSDIMRRSVLLHEKLAVNWDSLAEQYREAAPDLTDPKAWMPTWGPGDDS
jgi:galactofuranosylgalactofuranosylrhamnosyl-N-acetylglucosaminyl-diphospho-decaprenol beta-1,5/1,6-galactofuranosyltransferase